ncbi:MAG TPA: DMT family transporter [Xanthobacteraceae bacterium]|nr:DMT family transporter [Xanthobacteraceae bacterium]
MDLLTIGLMLLAALLHAGWHSLVKAGADQTVTLAGMGLVASVAALAALPFVPLPPTMLWPVLAASVALHVGYKLCLARAYANGDLGEAFPLARGMVPLFATTLAVATLGQVPSLGQSLGIGLVSTGLLMVMLERQRQRQPNWLLWSAAAGAGLAVAGYSVLDAYGIRLFGTWLGFTAWLIVIDNMVFLTLTRLQRGPMLWRQLAATRWRVLASGSLGLASFCVFLWALSRGPVGVVSALRETSMLFAIVLGVLLHRETLSVARVAGALLMVSGVAAIAWTAGG